MYGGNKLAYPRDGSKSDEEADRKWSCDYCTYENWPSSIKCTMCCGPRPPSMSESRDIFEISAYEAAGSARRMSPSPPSTLESNNGLGLKWACVACTYLNWPRSTRCVQCRSLRSVVVAGTATGAAGSTTAPSSGTRQGRVSPSTPQTCSPTPNQQLSEDSQIRNLADKFQNLSTTSSLTSVPVLPTAPCNRKWMCSACTYENYPKSLKCVICRTPKFDDPGGDSSPSPNVSRSETPAPSSGSETANSCSIQGATADLDCDSIIEQPKRKAGKKKLRDVDWVWLNACQSVVEGLVEPVVNYLKEGGDPTRQLTRQETMLLNQPSVFETGITLVHLCLKYKREEILTTVLETLDERRGRNGLKRMPSIIAPTLAKEIRKHVEACLRYKPGQFPCHFFTECTLFSLPEELVELSPAIQGHLWEELLDHEAQRDLEESEEHSPPAINWLSDVVMESGGFSRLYALWNRTAGDCLLDACLQAAWGICDREGFLRRTLSEVLTKSTTLFYPRWQEYECMSAGRMGYALNHRQLCAEWASVLRAAAQPGASLCQIHVFVLAHIFRRPIIVYGVKCIKSFRGEVLGLARFEGVYLPLLWDQSFCWKSPLTLGYTRGHFSALVPRLPLDGVVGAGAGSNIVGAVSPLGDDVAGGSMRRRGGGPRGTNYVPLVTGDGKLLPVHFLTHSEVGHEERILRQWLDVCLLENGGPLVAEQVIPRPNLLVAQMLDEWLNYYRQLSEMYTAPFRAKCPPTGQGYDVIENCSDSE